MYKHYIDNIRQTSPDHELVKNFDNIQNELNSISDNLVGSAVDPNFNKRLYKTTSMFNQFALPFEEAKQRYQKYNEIAAQADPDFVFDSKSNPANLGIHSFYDNPNLIAPKGVKGLTIADMGNKIFSPIAQGVSKLSTESQGRLMKIITKEGFTQPVIEAILQSVAQNDPTVIDNIQGVSKDIKELLKLGVEASQNMLNGLGIDENDPTYREQVMGWLKQGITSGSMQQIKQSVQVNPNFLTEAQRIQQEATVNQIKTSMAANRGLIQKYNTENPNQAIVVDKNGNIDFNVKQDDKIFNFAN